MVQNELKKVSCKTKSSVLPFERFPISLPIFVFITKLVGRCECALFAGVQEVMARKNNLQRYAMLCYAWLYEGITLI